MQDYTAMATLVRAFEQLREYRTHDHDPEYEPDAVASALELQGARVQVDIRSPLGRRAHRLGLLVRRQARG